MSVVLRKFGLLSLWLAAVTPVVACDPDVPAAPTGNTDGGTDGGTGTDPTDGGTDGGTDPTDGGTDGGTDPTDGGTDGGTVDPGPLTDRAQLGAGEYSNVVGSADGTMAIGWADVTDEQLGRPWLLRWGQPPVGLTRTATASVGSAIVSPAAPWRVLFVDAPSDATDLGRLWMADASDGRAVPVPAGSDALPSSVRFGVDGRTFAYLARVNLEKGLLYWSDGTNSNIVARDVSESTIQISADRKWLLAGSAVAALATPGALDGNLVVIDMANGQSLELAQGVQLVRNGRPAFSLSTDGLSIAYTTGAGALQKLSWTAGATTVPTPTVLASAGTLPTFSPDGAKVAFFSGGSVRVAGGSAQPLTVGQVTGPYLSPQFSPDGNKLVYCGNYRSVSAGKPLGDCFISTPSGPVPGTSGDQSVAVQMATDRVVFSPDSSFLTSVWSLEWNGEPDYLGVGEIFWMSLLQAPYRRQAVSQTYDKSGGVAAAAFDILDGNTIYYVAGVRESVQYGRLFKRGTAAADTDAQPVADNVVFRSLTTAPDRKSLMYISGERPRVGSVGYAGQLTVLDAAGGNPRRTEAVSEASFLSSTRYLAVVGDGAEAGVWSVAVTPTAAPNPTP